MDVVGCERPRGGAESHIARGQPHPESYFPINILRQRDQSTKHVRRVFCRRVAIHLDRIFPPIASDIRFFDSEYRADRRILETGQFSTASTKRSGNASACANWHIQRTGPGARCDIRNAFDGGNHVYFSIASDNRNFGAGLHLPRFRLPMAGRDRCPGAVLLTKRCFRLARLASERESSTADKKAILLGDLKCKSAI